MYFKVSLLLSALCISVAYSQLQQNVTGVDTRVLFRQGGELNALCQTSNDCREFGYDCVQERCVCRLRYMPDAEGKTCVGAIQQRCYYDAHCVPDAYCHDQKECRCKRETPKIGEDGWTCSGVAVSMSSVVLSIAACLAVLKMNC